MLGKCIQIQRIKQNPVQVRRFITANQAAIALRPFYFLVHPDRYAQYPKTRHNNEKNLQIFNGYLNELIPSTKQIQNQLPIKVNFSIMKENERFENVTLTLSGQDPIHIIKEALKTCNLSVKNLPEVKEKSARCNSYPSTSTPKWPTPEDLWQDLRMKDSQRRARNKRSFTSGHVLLNNLVQNRNIALERCQNVQKTNELLEDEILFLMQKTGAKNIIWSISWQEVFYLRCLKNLQLLLKQSDAKAQKIITNALNGHSLIFGRSSFICVDGSIQFGADDVPETWLSICREAAVRRFEIINVVRLAERVRELLGFANIKIDERGNLLQTTHQLQSLIVRISSQPKADREKVANLAKNTFIKVSNSYSSLVLFSDGYIQVPCNVNGQMLIEFLNENAEKSIRLHAENIDRHSKLQELKDECIEELKLSDLTWESTVPINDLIACIKRLTTVDDSIRNQIQGLRIKISSNANVHVLIDGSISIPTGFT